MIGAFDEEAPAGDGAAAADAANSPAPRDAAKKAVRVVRRCFARVREASEGTGTVHEATPGQALFNEASAFLMAVAAVLSVPFEW